eukprot:6463889-Amphidinium_carterae.1
MTSMFVLKVIVHIGNNKWGGPSGCRSFVLHGEGGKYIAMKHTDSEPLVNTIPAHLPHKVSGTASTFLRDRAEKRDRFTAIAKPQDLFTNRP